jgi:hypothetical protein
MPQKCNLIQFITYRIIINGERLGLLVHIRDKVLMTYIVVKVKVSPYRPGQALEAPGG